MVQKISPDFKVPDCSHRKTYDLKSDCGIVHSRPQSTRFKMSLRYV